MIAATNQKNSALQRLCGTSPFTCLSTGRAFQPFKNRLFCARMQGARSYIYHISSGRWTALVWAGIVDQGGGEDLGDHFEGVFLGATQDGDLAGRVWL